MKPKIRFLAVLLILTLAPVPLIQTVAASHLTSWTETYNETIDPTVTSNGSSNGGSSSKGGTVLVGVEDADIGELYFYRCLASTGDCSQKSIASQADGVAFDFSIDQDDTGAFIGCHSYTASGTTVFLRSTTDGQTWASSSLTGFQGGGCGTGKSGSTAFMGGVNHTTDNEIRVAKSSNGGTTWGTEFFLNSGNAEDGIALDAKVRFGVADASNVIITFIMGTGNLGRCYTTAGGDTTEEWFCNTESVGASGQNSYFDHTANILYGIAGSSTAITFYKYETVDGLIETSTIASPTSGTGAVGITKINSTTLVASWLDNAADVEAHYAVSHDLGVSWDENTVFTGTEQTQGNQLDSIGATLNNGQALTAFSYTTEAAGTDDHLFKAYSAGDSPTIEAAATASVTGLVGFDVNPDGSIVIARTETGENVRLYDFDLDPTASPIDTNCGQSLEPFKDAVMAKDKDSGNSARLVSFLDCTSDGDAEFMMIRTASGETPSAQDFEDAETGEDCTDFVDTCPFNIETTGWDEPFDSAMGQLGQVRDFPIDYSNNQEEPPLFAFDNRMVAWAFASQQCANTGDEPYCDGNEDGFVGIATYTGQTNNDDEENLDVVNYVSGQDARDFCLGLDGGVYYLAAVGPGVNSLTWTASIGTVPDPVDNNGVVLDATISGSPSPVGAASSSAIACGGGQVLVREPNAIRYGTRSGAFIDSITGLAPASSLRSVSISDEFYGPAHFPIDERGTSCNTAFEDMDGCVQYGVYIDFTTTPDQLVVLNLTGGSITEAGVRYNMPSGALHSVRMLRTAQEVFVATETAIARFHVTNETTVIPVDTPGDIEPPVEGDGEGTGLFGGSGVTIGAAFGVGAFGGNLFLGALLMGIVAYGVGTGYGNVMDTNTMTPRALRVNPWAAAIGAAIGFLVAWGFGFFSTAVVFSMVALVVLIVGVKLMVSRG